MSLTEQDKKYAGVARELYTNAISKEDNEELVLSYENSIEKIDNFLKEEN